MIFIEQIVVDKSTLHTIEVDGASTGDSIFIDDVAIDFRIGADRMMDLSLLLDT